LDVDRSSSKRAQISTIFDVTLIDVA